MPGLRYLSSPLGCTPENQRFTLYTITETIFRPAAGSFTRCPRPYSVVSAPRPYSCQCSYQSSYKCPYHYSYPDCAFRSARFNFATLPHFWHLISITPVQLPSLSQSLLPQLGQRFTTLTSKTFAAITLRLSNGATLFPYAMIPHTPLPSTFKTQTFSQHLPSPNSSIRRSRISKAFLDTPI